jgi:hypothetical protein
MKIYPKLSCGRLHFFGLDIGIGWINQVSHHVRLRNQFVQQLKPLRRYCVVQLADAPNGLKNPWA